MAPSIAEAPASQIVVPVKADPGSIQEKPRVRRIIDEEGGKTTASYPNYLPTWDYGEKYPPLEPFNHLDHGKDADPSFKNLLPEGSKIQKLTPKIGSEVTGIQLSKLNSAGKDQLALLVAQRKALDFGGYFGRHHIHPTSGSPEGYPEIHLVHRNNNAWEFDQYLAEKNSSVSWHSDVTYEKQPSGTTFLYLLDGPEVGGDTAFVDQVEAYNRLSPAIKERLHGLKAIHSGTEQAENSRNRDGVVRRESVQNEHPIFRTHPVTGEKALYVNAGFTRSIVELKKEESDALLGFLLAHVGRGIDYQARIRWAPRTVVVWDRRHLARITPQAEQPYETPYISEEAPSQP
ncbi:hypothetical protein N7488_010708 [Penicillium malachiteum]|nr:hypothetical protein N7488_010708 [Penicillium malachiteum]